MQCIHNCTGTILCMMNQCMYVFADRRSVRWTSGCRRCWGRLDSCQPSSQVQHRRPVSTQDHQAWTSRWQHTAGTWWAWHGHGLAQGQQWRGQTVSRYSGCWPAAAEQVRRRPQQGFPAATASNAISLDVTNKKNKQFEVVVLLFSQILLVTVAEFSASYLVFLWDMGQPCKSRKASGL